jgi:GNAT superfamily N-acetyltransferase
MRWMKKKDIPSLVTMQDSSFNSLKFDKGFFNSVVSSRKSPSFGSDGFNSYVSYVCDLEKEPIGYVIYKVSLLKFDMNLHSNKMSKQKNRFPMAGEIVSFCVDNNHRKKGVGRFIMESLIERFSGVIELSLKDFSPRPFIIYALSSEKDLGSHLFFRSLGFKARRVSWDAFGEGHDGYTFVYESVSSKSQFCESSK